MVIYEEVDDQSRTVKADDGGERPPLVSHEVWGGASKHDGLVSNSTKLEWQFALLHEAFSQGNGTQEQ